MTDLERADTFSVYRDMGDIVNPTPNESTHPTRFAFFQYGNTQNSHHNPGNGNKSDSKIAEKKEGVYGGNVTFAGMSNKPTQQEIIEPNNLEGEDGVLDEETWNWSALIARVFAFFLLFLIIICIGLEAITRRFLILAAIICVLLVIVIIGTYVDLREKCCWWICPRKRQLSDNPLENSSSTSSIANPLMADVSKIQITDKLRSR